MFRAPFGARAPTTTTVRLELPVLTSPMCAPRIHLTPLIGLLACGFALGAQTPVQTAAQTAAKRPMTFLDVQHMRNVGAPVVSPDGKWMLYTLSVPNWKEAKRATDVYLVSTERGVASTRQMTFTKDKNENSPRWSRDGSFFVFSSNRDAPAATQTQLQLYLMRPDGGEANKITEAKDGVGSFAFSKDGKWLVFSAGKLDEQQLWALPIAGIDTAKAVQVTKHRTPVSQWQISDDSRRIFFLAADTVDADEKARIEKKFDVRIRNPESPISHIWVLDVATKQERRLTTDTSYTVTDYTVSDDAKWVGYRAIPNNRYARTVTEANINGDLYLLNVESGAIERVTKNVDIGEGQIRFSPNGQLVAFSAPDDFTYFRNQRIYVRPITAANGQWKKLGGSFDGDVTIGFWSKDGRTIYFTEGVKATNQLLAVDVQTDKVTQLTKEEASLFVTRDEDSGTVLVTYTDAKTPQTLYAVSSPDKVATRSAWRQLTNANPQVATFALGDAEEITWKSTDGKMVGGVLVKPINYQPGKRYPLIVAIHGGPAGADVLGFNGGYGSQIYAGAGYAVLMPNYRGSTNYGEAHKTGIVGNYFEPGYNDIMTGVDHLIAQGIVDPNQMGALGWSAGGHWSNWILTHTDRFKAISSGAGTSNWISMYAQSDVQRNRQHYLGGKLPYDDFEAYWNQSPLKYIKNAKTPTMIHVVDGDPRVPRPQSEELHMALKKLGVPTELFVYPGNTHGIPDPRNQLVKSVAEMAWMDKYVRGQGNFNWKMVLKTLEEPKRDSTAVATAP